MDYSLIKDGMVVGHVSTMDADFQPPEGFTLAPRGPDGYRWTGENFVPPDAPAVDHAVLAGAFSPGECALILARGAALALGLATVRDGTGARYHQPERRRSTVGWFRPGDDPDIDPVFVKIWAIASAENARLKVDIERIPELQFTRYEAAAAGHFAWHADVGVLSADGFERRLSVVIMLSDPAEYEGGQFELEGGGSVPLALGDVIVFPSTALHRVTPVTAGTRHSLVAWVEGRG